MDHGTDIEKGLYTFSEVRSCFVLHPVFPFLSLIAFIQGSSEQRLSCTTVPTAPKSSVERNDVPMRPRPQAAKGAVLDEHGHLDLFVLRKLEPLAAAPITSGIYQYRLALSAALLVKHLVWIPDSLSMLDSNGLQPIWAMVFILYIVVVTGSLKFEPAPTSVASWLIISAQTSPFSRDISYTALLCLSFTDFIFPPACGRKLLCLLYQTIAELSFSKGWTLYPQYFEALSGSLHYLILLLVLDGTLSILCTILGRFPATGPNPDALPRFYVTVGTTMYVLTFLAFVWSWNVQPVFNDFETCPIIYMH